jgi:hypothetical protein
VAIAKIPLSSLKFAPYPPFKGLGVGVLGKGVRALTKKPLAPSPHHSRPSIFRTTGRTQGSKAKAGQATRKLRKKKVA